MNRPLVVVITGNQKKSKSPVKHEVFSFYSKIAKILGENEWKEMFENFSKGINYGKIKFSGNKLSVKIEGVLNVFEVKIPESFDIDSIEEKDIKNYTKCKKFLKTIIEKFEEETNENEQLNNEHTNENSEDEDEYLNKFKSGARNQTDFIYLFAKKKCEKFGLSNEVCESIVGTISLLFMSKRLVSKSVYLKAKDGTIHSIEGIKIDYNGLKIDSSKLNNPKITKPKKDKHKPSFKELSIFSKIEKSKM